MILPPFQGQGHGCKSLNHCPPLNSLTLKRLPFPPQTAQLYNALYDYAQTLDIISELTVEDPSEAFEDLRDRNDLLRLKDDPEVVKVLQKGAPVDRAWMEKVRREGKYAKVRTFFVLFPCCLPPLGGQRF